MASVLNSAVNNFFIAINNEIDNIESKNNIKINSSEKIRKVCEEINNIVIKSSQFIAGSYFYPEKYGIKSDNMELIGLLNDFDKDELYKQVHYFSFNNMKEEDKNDEKFVDCLAFSKYLQVLFWNKIEKDEIKKMRKKHKKF